MSNPSELRIGDTWSWEFSLPDYPAPTWVLTLYLTNAAGQFSVVATGDGALHTVAQTAAQSAARTAGRYAWFARVVSGTVAYTVDQGYIELLPNLGSAVEIRSWARRALDSLEAQIESDTPFDKASVSYGGRQITFRSVREMIEFRDYLRSQVALEEDGARLGLGRDIRVRLSRV